MQNYVVFLSAPASLKSPRAHQAVLCSPCALEGERAPGLQTLLVHPSFVPCLAGVLPLLLLCVWKGQQGQHGEGKEGRLCPPRPPGCPEGKGAWRAVEQRKRVSGKKKTPTQTLTFLFLPRSLAFSQSFCSLIRPFSSPFFLSLHICLSHLCPDLTLTGFNTRLFITSMAFKGLIHVKSIRNRLQATLIKRKKACITEFYLHRGIHSKSAHHRKYYFHKKMYVIY